MATVTSLNFNVTSGWNSDGVDEAMADIKALKEQLSDLNSQKLQLTADSKQVTAEIAEVKKEIDDLNQDIKLGVNADGADETLAILKAKLEELNSQKVDISIDQANLDASIADAKVKLDALTKDQKIKTDVDTDSLRSSLDDAKAQMKDATDNMSNDWDSLGKAGRAAGLNLVSAIVLLLPALIPLSEAVLGLGGAIVSAFGGAAIAAGVFGFSVEQLTSSAETYNTNMTTLKATLLAAQQQLAVTSKTSSSYASDQLAVAQAQTAVNAEMAKTPRSTVMVANALTQLTYEWNQFQAAAGKAEAPIVVSFITAVGSALHELLPIIPAVAGALKPLADAFQHFVNGDGNGGGDVSAGSPLETFVNWIVQNGVPNLQRLLVFLEDLGVAVGQLGASFTSQGAGLTQWLDKVGTSLDNWGANGGFTRFAAEVSSMMPEINKAIGSLAEGIGHVITALHDFSGSALSELTIVSQLIAHLPIGVIEAFFVAFQAYKVIAITTAIVKSFALAVDALKVAYGAAELATIAFAIGTQGATAAESDNVLITTAMTAGRYAAAVATGIASVATDAWTVATIALEVAMSPFAILIGAIVVAAAALAFGIYELVDHWSTVWSAMKTAFDDAWSGIKEGFDDVVSWIRGEWGLFVLAIPVVGWLLYVVANWKSIWSDMETAFTNTVNALKTAWDTVSSALSGAWDATWNALKAAAMAVWNALQSAWQDELNGIKESWDTVSSALSGAWDTFWNALKTAAVAVWDFFVTDWTVQLDLVRDAFDSVASTISGAWDTFWNALKSTATTVWSDITSGVSGFASGIENAFSSLVSTVSGIWQGIESVFSTPVNFIIRIWNDVAGAIGLPTINTSTASQGASTAEAGTAAGNNAGVHGLAGGGPVSGPGGPREDKVPIMASNGEYMMNADSVSHYGTGVMDAINTKKFAGGGLIGDVTGFVSGLASGASHVFGDVTGDAIDALKSVAQTVVYDTAKPVINGIVSAVPNPVPGVGSPGGQVPHAAISTLGDKILDSLKASQSTAVQEAASVGGTVPTGSHLTDITQALAKAGVAQSQWSTWEAGLNTLITRESSWNPTIVNTTDSNAAAGHPSQGLMQLIPSTFAQYSLGGSITDPVSNIVAGIRYIIAQYGSINNVQQANASLPPKGYDTGGALPPGMTLANNTTGTVEGVLNPTGLAAIGGLNALTSLNTGGGGFKTAGGAAGGTVSTGGTTVSINAPITINAADGATAQQLADLIEEEFEKLATMIETEVGSH